jgi:hypothetical protein
MGCRPVQTSPAAAHTLWRAFFDADACGNEQKRQPPRRILRLEFRLSVTAK